MKPLKLTMSAFGSFAKETTIDFASVQQGVFLITGDTGAGKTTIFDAISFALYGKTSGGARDGSMMRSQYAGEQDMTYVEFVFLHRGQEYRIYRSPEYSVKSHFKNGKERTIVRKNEVRFVKPGNVELYSNKEQDINQDIISLIGLDAGQFSQMVMIAQGDFMKLLGAKSDERKKIFGKLFSTELYGTIRDQLKNWKDQKQAELAKNGTRCEVERDRAACVEDSPYAEKLGELKSKSLAGLDEFLEVLEQILQDETFRETHMEDETNTLRKKLELTEQQISSAAFVNQLFQAWEKAVRDLQAWKERAGQIQQKRQEAEAGRRSQKVNILEERYQQAQKTVQATEYMIQKLRREESASAVEAEQAKQGYETARKYQDENLPSWSETQTKISLAMPSYEQLEEAQREAQGLLESCREKEHKTVILGETLNQINSEQDEIRKQQTVLENSEKTVTELQFQTEQRQKKIDEICLLAQRSIRLEQMSGEWKRDQKELIEQMQMYQSANRLYEDMQQQYLLGQAGILAKDLKEGMACPVCGSEHHPQKAEWTENIPSKSQVDSARKEKNNAEERQNIAAAKASESQQRYQILREQVEREYHLYIDAEHEIKGTREETDRIQSQLNLEKNQFAQMQVQLHQAQQNAATYKRNGERQTVLEEKRKETEESRQTAVSELQKERLRQAAVQTKVETIRSGLVYPDKKDAKTALDEVTNHMKSAKEKTEQRESQYHKLSNNLQMVRGNLQMQEKAYGEQCENSEKEKTGYLNGLTQYGFTDEADYRTRFRSQEETERLEEEVRQYQKQEEHLDSQIKTLGQQLEGKQKTDTTDLETEKQILLKQRELLEQQKLTIHSQNMTNQNVLSNLRGYWEERKKLQEEAAAVTRVWQTVSGNLDKTVKWDLETYVQRQYLKRILNAANHRLIKMSDGQFLLQLKDISASGKAKNEGLDLVVYSVVTDSIRDIRTLSGGESFMAALSMALGLSDIIQREAGAIRMDMMFIDEGFGSLDENSRNQAIGILHELAGNNRIVGIISHVSELKQQMDVRLQVTKTNHGSSVYWENEL